MRMAVLHGLGDLRVDDAQRPAAGARDLVIQVKAAGICGTDLHFRQMGPRFKEPMPLGHEFAGEVIEVGKDVTQFRVGDRVAYNSNSSPADMGRGGECGGFSDYVILRGVDGIVFVADSQQERMDANVEALDNLMDNLKEHGYDFNKIPYVLQLNKRDLPDILSVEALSKELRKKNEPVLEAVAFQGTGVFETLKEIAKQVLQELKAGG